MARRNLALAPEPITARDVLRLRQADAAAAHRAVQAAEALLERAQADVEAATARVAAGEEAEARIRAHKVQTLRDGGSATAALPEVLTLARNLHRDAKDGLGDAQAVMATLRGDLEAARAEYQRIGKTVELAAQDVVRTEDAARIAKALREARDTVDRLTWALTGVTRIHVRQNFVGFNPSLIGTPFEAHQGPMTFAPEVLAALNPQPTGGAGVAERHYAEWTTYFRALQQDAEIAAPA